MAGISLMCLTWALFAFAPVALFVIMFWHTIMKLLAQLTGSTSTGATDVMEASDEAQGFMRDRFGREWKMGQAEPLGYDAAAKTGLWRISGADNFKEMTETGLLSDFRPLNIEAVLNLDGAMWELKDTPAEVKALRAEVATQRAMVSSFTIELKALTEDRSGKVLRDADTFSKIVDKFKTKFFFGKDKRKGLDLEPEISGEPGGEQ